MFSRGAAQLKVAAACTVAASACSITQQAHAHPTACCCSPHHTTPHHTTPHHTTPHHTTPHHTTPHHTTPHHTTAAPHPSTHLMEAERRVAHIHQLWVRGHAQKLGGVPAAKAVHGLWRRRQWRRRWRQRVVVQRQRGRWCGRWCGMWRGRWCGRVCGRSWLCVGCGPAFVVLPPVVVPTGQQASSGGGSSFTSTLRSRSALLMSSVVSLVRLACLVNLSASCVVVVCGDVCCGVCACVCNTPCG
jgi:hypothetical protein